MSTLCRIGVSGIGIRGWFRARRLGLGGTGDRETAAACCQPRAGRLTQPLTADDAPAVDEGAVARESLVDERPLRSDLLEQRVGARDLLVSAQHDVRVGLGLTVSRQRSRDSAKITCVSSCIRPKRIGCPPRSAAISRCTSAVVRAAGALRLACRSSLIARTRRADGRATTGVR